MISHAFPAISRTLLRAGLFAALLIPGVGAASLAAQESSTQAPDTAYLQQPGAMGWSAFTEEDRQRLDLDDAQFSRLKEMDSKLEERYNALGIEPWTHADFPALNRERLKSVQDILNPRQYERWAAPLAPVPSVPPTLSPDPATPQ